MKQKIVWAETMRMTKSNVNNFPRFSVVDNGIFTDKTAFIGRGKQLDKMCTVLNSEFAIFWFINNVAVLDNGGFCMSKIYIENIPIPNLSKINNEEDVYTAFGFSDDEITFIKSVVARRKEKIVNGAE